MTQTHDEAFAAFQERREAERAATAEPKWRKISRITGGGFVGSKAPDERLVYAQPVPDGFGFKYGWVPDYDDPVGFAPSAPAAKRAAGGLFAATTTIEKETEMGAKTITRKRRAAAPGSARPARESGVASDLAADLHARVLDEVRKAAGSGLGELKKKGYVRVTTGGHTLAYVGYPTRSGVRVTIPAEKGGYDDVRVADVEGVKTAVAAVKRRAKAVTAS